MTQINLIEQIYPLNGDHRIQTVNQNGRRLHE